jgi:hypothetical protein
MARPQLILPRADTTCGKVFYGERRAADEHRIALEFWNQATGDLGEGYHLAVYRCKRCGGFHIGKKRIKPTMTAGAHALRHSGGQAAAEMPNSGI